MAAKIVHFEGAEGFALLVVPAFIGYWAASMAGDIAVNMRHAGVVLIQIGVGCAAAAAMVAVILGISAFALSTPSSYDTNDEER